jgi:hypothetical protein
VASMKLVWWMISGSVLSCLLVTIVIGPSARTGVWLGMLGPLASAVVSWIALERRYVRRPAALTGLLIRAFAAKMIFFAIYVSVLLKVGIVRPVPFVVSFMCYFVSLHVLEAIGLRRLLASVLTAPSDGSSRV